MSDDEDVYRGDDTGAGSRDKSIADDAGSKAIREASLRERLQAQLTQLRAQVRRLNLVLAGGADTRAAPIAQPSAGYATNADASRTPTPSPSPPSMPLEGDQTDDDQPGANRPATDRVTSAAAPPPPALALPSTGDGQRGTDVAAGGRVGVERPGALVLLEINETDLRAMIHDGLLSRADIANPARISAALQIIVARWRTTVAVPPPPQPGERADRRSGRERRRGSPRSSSLLSYVTGTEFDRRKGGDRRKVKRARTEDTTASVLPPANLVTLADARSKLAAQQRRRANPTADEAAAPVAGAALLSIRRRRSPAADADRRLTGQPRSEEQDQGAVFAGNRPVAEGDPQKTPRRHDVLPPTEAGGVAQFRGADEHDER